MKTQIVNFITADQYQQIEENGKIVGKFVLARHNQSILILFGAIESYAYHANILDAYCTRENIATNWDAQPDMLSVFDDQFSILGGGWFEHNKVENSFLFFGQSKAYGKFESSDLNYLLTQDEYFNGFKIK